MKPKTQEFHDERRAGTGGRGHDRPHYSPSQMNMYWRCGEQWRRRYVEKEIIPPGIAMVKGGSFHEGARTNHLQKIETREDLKPKDIIDASMAQFSAYIQAGVLLSKKERGRGQMIILNEAEQATVQMAGFYAQDVAPKFQPVAAEQKVVVPGKIALVGYIDLTLEGEIISDLKWSKRAFDPHNDIQLSFYAIAYHYEQGNYPAGVRIDQFKDLKKGPKWEPLESTRDMRDEYRLRRRLNAMHAGIQAGIFLPAPPDSWMCSSKYCGYFETCIYAGREE